MLTGDNRATAERVAGELGMDTVFADVLPGQKADKVKELQARGPMWPWRQQMSCSCAAILMT